MSNKSTLKIKDRVYIFTKMPPIPCSLLGLKLGKLLAPTYLAMGIAQNADSGAVNKGVVSKNKKSIEEVLTSSISGINAEELHALGIEALIYDSYAGKDEASVKPLSDRSYFDKWFTEYPSDILIAAKHAIIFQVRDFLVSAADGLSNVQEDRQPE